MTLDELLRSAAAVEPRVIPLRPQIRTDYLRAVRAGRIADTDANCLRFALRYARGAAGPRGATDPVCARSRQQ